MDQMTKKLMIMHKALQPSDDIDRLHMLRKGGRRGHTNIEEYAETTI